MDVSTLATRRWFSTGPSKRRISSTAFGIKVGSSMRSCHCVRSVRSARRPLPIVFIVVSWPARAME